MAFTFQINEDVEFEHHQTLLDKADVCRPVLIEQKEAGKRIVELISDDTSLCGVNVQASHEYKDTLTSKPLQKGDKIMYDFEQHGVGYFQVSINHVGSPMDAPLYIRLRFAEVAAELAQESSTYDGWLSRSWIQEEYVHLDELPTTLTLPRRYSFRFVEICVLDTSPKWQVVCYDAIRSITTSATPIKELPVLQDCLLQKIQDVSIKTLENCMQDVFEDGPKRDRRLWLGDLRLQALANYASFDTLDLVKRCLYLFAAMPAKDGRIPANVFVKPTYTPDDTFLFDYSLFFISTLYDYLQHSYEDILLQDLYPIAKKQMDVSLQYVNLEGKLVLTEDYPVFIDWSNAFDKESAGTGVMIYALKQFICLCEMVHEKDIDFYRQALQRLTTYARQQLFDEEKGLFVSGEKKEYNIASQVWMVLAQYMTPQENKRIMKECVAQLFPIHGIATPYMYHHIVEALLIADLKDEAILLMKSYWGEMISLGADTFWEAFDPDQSDYSPYGSPIISSYCHAWSCTPVYIFKQYNIR